MHLQSYLALGDSYTIGEGLPLFQSFPYQTVAALRQRGHAFCAPEIVAVTGWTTNELEASIKERRLLSKYDFVSLLIGVNDQYRGMDAIGYKENFEGLLKTAIDLANGKKDHVIIVSIPDYAVTPFAKDSDTDRITREIDVFNSVNKALSIQYKVEYLDITPHSRQAGALPGMTTSDALHPSAEIYQEWASQLAEKIAASIK